MRLRHWKTQWIPLQIYVLIVVLKVKELLTVFLRTDTRLHQESTEKGWNTIIENQQVVHKRFGKGIVGEFLHFQSIIIHGKNKKIFV